jgi:hypothetical protein
MSIYAGLQAPRLPQIDGGQGRQPPPPILQHIAPGARRLFSSTSRLMSFFVAARHHERTIDARRDTLCAPDFTPRALGSVQDHAPRNLAAPTADTIMRSKRLWLRHVCLCSSFFRPGRCSSDSAQVKRPGTAKSHRVTSLLTQTLSSI